LGRGAPDPTFLDVAGSGTIPDPEMLDLAGSASGSGAYQYYYDTALQ